MAKQLQKEDLKIGMKFKSKAEYYNGYTFKVETIDIEKNKIELEVRDVGTRYFENQEKKLDAFIFDVNFGCYEIINERLHITKHNQLEDCGSHSD